MRKIFLFFCLIGFALSACASHQPKAEETEEPGQVVDNGPVLDSGEVSSEPAEAGIITSNVPEEPAGPPLNCVVLGPGMAKAFAEVGALEVLQEQVKDINCIIGVEMGALVGALYADKKNINAVQWQLFKLKREFYLDSGFLSFGAPKAAGKKVHQLLVDLFGKRTAKDLGIRFIALAAEATKNTLAQNEDMPLADAISASLAVPGVFAPWLAPDHHYYSSALGIDPLPLDIAHAIGAQSLWAIQVLGPDVENPVLAGLNKQEVEIAKAFAPAAKMVHLQSEGTRNLIVLDTSRFPLWDFTKQQDLIEVGRDGARAALGAHP